MSFRREEALRILAIAVMMASLASAVSDLALRLVPAFQPAPLVGLAFLVCLEGVAADRMARQLPDSNARTRFHIIEWVVILLVLRLVLALSQGLAAFAATAERWLGSPVALVDWGLATAALLLLLVWFLGVQMARAFEALEPPLDVAPPKDSAAYYAWSTRPQSAESGEGWQALVKYFLGGGVLLLLASGLARLDIQAMLSLRNPALAGIVGNALLYFALGFILLAQGHYSLLRLRWERRSAPVSQALARRWLRLAIGFTVGLALVALLLPVRPSLDLFAAAFHVLASVLYVILGLVMGIFAVLGYLLSLLMRLFGQQATGEPAPEPTMAITPPPTPVPAQHVGWWEAIQGLVLWAIVLAVLIYALVRFVRERRGLLASLRLRVGPLGWLSRLLTTFWRWFSRTSVQVGTRVRSLLTRRQATQLGHSVQRRLRWFRPRNAREQVRLLYLLGLQQLSQAGLERRAADTPYEYAQRVEPNLPEGAPDLETLTQAFVAARYSRRDFEPAEVSPLQSAYRRLRRLARRITGKQSAP